MKNVMLIASVAGVVALGAFSLYQARELRQARNERDIALNKADGRRYYDLLLNPGAAARSGGTASAGEPRQSQKQPAVSPAFSRTVESSMSMSSSPCMTMT